VKSEPIGKLMEELCGTSTTSFPSNCIATPSIGNHLSAITSSDLDGNGIPELFVTTIGDNKLILMNNVGGFSFTSSGVFSSGIQPAQMAVGDFNIDGDLDVAVIGQDSDDISIFQQQQGGSCQCDDVTENNYAMQFDGNEVVEVPHSSSISFPIGSDFTLEFWMYPSGTSGQEGILGKRNNNISTGQCEHVEYQLTIDGASGTVTWGMDSAQKNGRLSSKSTVTQDTWVHIAVTYDGTTRRMYWNGILDTAEVGFFGRPDTSQLTIGTISNLNNCGNPFNGQIDEVRIWNVTRSATQIAETYNKLLDGTTTGLVGYWNFDEEEFSQAVCDISGTGNIGTLGESNTSAGDDPVRVLSTAPVSDCPDETIQFGTTVIIHGLAPGGSSGEGFDDEQKWVIPMANAIVERMGSGRVIRIEEGLLPSMDGGFEGEQVIAFSWIPESNESILGYAEGAADVLFARLIQGYQGNYWDLNKIHIIAHSRGNVVASELIQRLGFFQQDLEAEGIIVDNKIHLTSLDSHPWDDVRDDLGICDPCNAKDESVNNGIDLIDALGSNISKSVIGWSNVGFWDNYHQDECGFEFSFDVHDFNGLAGTNLRGIGLSSTSLSSLFSSKEHRKVHSWYFGTIATGCTQLPVSDGDNILIDYSLWYDDFGTPRALSGFNLNRAFNTASAIETANEDLVQPLGDNALCYAGLFNGSFSLTGKQNCGSLPLLNDDFFTLNSPPQNNKSHLPGWSFQGGASQGNVNEKKLRLSASSPIALHNPALIPFGAITLDFDLRVYNIDSGDDPNVDRLEVTINNVIVYTLPLNEKHKIKPESIDISSHEGKVCEIGFRISKGTSLIINSGVLVDNVRYNVGTLACGSSFIAELGSPAS